MQKNLSFKKSLITKFVVLAYAVTVIILMIISTLYINHYNQLKESKEIAITLESLMINTKSLQALQALRNEVRAEPTNIETHNKSLENLKTFILNDLREMAKMEREIPNTHILDHTANYVANIKSNKKNKELFVEELDTIHDQLTDIQSRFIMSKSNRIQAILDHDNTFISLICIVGFLSVLLVIYFVWKYTNKLKKSLDNLLIATNEINKKNYSYQAPVIGENELSQVTIAFNKMTKQLGEHKQKLLEVVELKNKLLAFTNLFSRALTEEEVYDVVFKHAFSFIGAGVGTAYILNSEADTLLLRKYSGLSKYYSKEWPEIKIELDLPICHALKSQRPVHIASSKIYYPQSESDFQLYFTPIIIESRAIGVLTFAYPAEKFLSDNEKVFLVTLTHSCANALYRTKLYDNAKKAITVRDDFLSIASHELQTPLTPLKMQMQIYKSKILRNEKENLTSQSMLHFLNNSITQIDKISYLIDDLLNVSNINSGRLVVHRKRFNLKNFIDKLLMSHTLYTKSSLKVNIQNETAPEFEVNWDGYKVEQILLNLLSNAAKYANNYEVDMNIYADDKNIFIKLRDYGPGVLPEDRERIFKKYERIVNQTNIRGLGLGLFISKEIALLHDGDLKIIDTEGPGTSFLLNLPINNS